MFFLFLPYLVFSQSIDESVNYINYSIKDGLPSSETYDIYQDSKGYIWIGTDNGVVRYDGANFETFTTRDGLTDNTIFKIQEDYLGRIWFLTYNRKLCYYEDGEFIPYKFNDVLLKATEEIYVGNTLTNFDIDTLDNIKLTCSSLLENPNQEFLITNTGDLSKLESEKKNELLFQIQFSPKIYEVLTLSQSLFASNNTDVKFIVQNVLYGRIHLYNEDSTMVVTHNNGVTIYNKNTKSVSRNFLEGFYITGFCRDFEGGYWCSSLYNGVFYIPNPSLGVFRLGNQINQSHNDGIFEQKNLLYFSFNHETNLFRIEKGQSQITREIKQINIWDFPKNKLKTGIKFENPLPTENSPYITSLVLLDSNLVLASGVYVQLILIKEITPFEDANNPILSTFQNKFGQIWQRTEKGQVLKNSNMRFVTEIQFLPSFSPKVLNIFKQSNGTIWLGTLDGLFVFDLKSGNTKKTNKYPDFQNKRIQDITESNDGTLFFATKADGIFIASNNIVTQITEKENLLGNTVNQLIYDTVLNQVWVATNKGICVLQKKNDKWIPIPEITKYDGLETPDIRQIYFYDNYLYFANNTGVGRIKVSDLNQPLPSPLFNLTNVIANDSVIGQFENIKLRYDSNNIQINYQAIGYKSQNHFNYSYRMNTGNFTWQTTTSSNITLTALPPGNYKIQIKATDVYGVDSEIKEVTFEIVPAFWMTLWFKAGILLIAVVIGYRASINTIRAYRNQAKFQKTINELQVVSLQSKMSPHFIFNSLNSIQNFILKNETKKANDYLLEFSRLIRIILQNSDVTSIVLDKELDILQMYVDLERKRLRSDFAYVIEMGEDIDRHNCLLPSLLIQPYIENSIWHGKVYSNPEGEIKITIKKEGAVLKFDIKDNGIGVENAQKSRIKPIGEKHESIGTSITKKRIQLLSELNNQISEVEIFELYPNLSPNNFVGTCVRFNIPYVLKEPKNE